MSKCKRYDTQKIFWFCKMCFKYTEIYKVLFWESVVDSKQLILYLPFFFYIHDYILCWVFGWKTHEVNFYEKLSFSLLNYFLYFVCEKIKIIRFEMFAFLCPENLYTPPIPFITTYDYVGNYIIKRFKKRKHWWKLKGRFQNELSARKY